MTAGPVRHLSVALGATGQLIAAVRDQQWSDPTPCPDWTVRDLVSHLVAGNSWFARAVGDQVAERAYQTSRPDGDLAMAYRDSATALLDAFGRPGVLDRIVAVPIGSVPGLVALHLRITEVLVHGWDLARATGQPAEFPEDLAEEELAFSRGKVADIPPDRRPFAPPQPVADDAAAIDRLAAFLGRDVSKHSPDATSHR